jgi:hypothetical protein
MMRPATDPIRPRIDPTLGYKTVTKRGNTRIVTVSILNYLSLSSLSLKSRLVTNDLKKWLMRGKQQNNKLNRAILIKKARILVVPNIIIQFYVISIFPV